MSQETAPKPQEQRRDEARANQPKATVAGPPYEVGYGKPPKHSRFPPGQSGNRKGRPKGSRNFGLLLDKELSQTVEVTDRGRRSRMAKLQVGLRQLLNKAASGDVQALNAVWQLMAKTGRLAEPDGGRSLAPAVDPRDLQALCGLLEFFRNGTAAESRRRRHTMTAQLSDVLTAYRGSFPLFATKAFNVINPGQQFSPTTAYLAVAHHLSLAADGKIKRLIITVPPRSGKSLLASVALPAYILGRDPTRRIICASYSGELSSKFGRDCRSLMVHPSYRQIFPGVAIAGKNTETEVETARGGVRFATSVGGTLTGRGGNYIVIDDPMKPDEATSTTARERIWQWFVGTVGSRLDNKADDVIVVVMQRLHVDDLVGRLLEAGGWHHLSIPAIAEIEESIPVAPGRTIRRKVGDILDPVREPREVLDQIRQELGTAAFEAQYLQAPVPPDGGIIKWSWFPLYREPPTQYVTDMIVHSWDTAMKAEQINDYSVGTVWLVRGVDYYLIDLVRARLVYPELKRAVRDLAKRHKPHAVLIEDKGSGTSLYQEMRWEGFGNLIKINPVADKITRLSTQSAKIEAGQVHLPERATWLADFQAEVKQFPNGKHDDQVDSMSQFLGWIAKKQRYRSQGDWRGHMGR